MSTGHALSRAQISKHGRDRYPTVGAQYSKVLDEAGELGEALFAMAARLPPHSHDDDGTVEGCPGCFTDPDLAEVRKEYADVGLALYALGDKLGLDLLACMSELVHDDERTFA
jgi:hypothetical protein